MWKQYLIRSRIFETVLIALFTAALVVATTEETLADDITIGTASVFGANCLPFGCLGSHDYQQIYSGSAFLSATPLEITAVSFYKDPYFAVGVDSITTPNFTIALSTTNKAVGGLDLNFATNLGSDNTTVFSGILSVGPLAVGAEFTLSFLQPFTYDPTSGNLLLTIHSDTGFTTQNLTATSFYMASENPSTTSSRLTSDNGIAQDNSALVTTFAITPVPEPATALLLSAGVAGLAVQRRPARSASL